MEMITMITEIVVAVSLAVAFVHQSVKLWDTLTYVPSKEEMNNV